MNTKNRTFKTRFEDFCWRHEGKLIASAFGVAMLFWLMGWLVGIGTMMHLDDSHWILNNIPTAFAFGPSLLLIGAISWVVWITFHSVYTDVKDGYPLFSLQGSVVAQLVCFPVLLCLFAVMYGMMTSSALNTLLVRQGMDIELLRRLAGRNEPSQVMAWSFQIAVGVTVGYYALLLAVGAFRGCSTRSRASA